jgi:hypothetical protein
VVVLVGDWGVKLAVPRSSPFRSRGFSLRRVRIRDQRVLLREVMRVVSSWREGNGGILVLVLGKSWRWEECGEGNVKA